MTKAERKALKAQETATALARMAEATTAEATTAETTTAEATLAATPQPTNGPARTYTYQGTRQAAGVRFVPDGGARGAHVFTLQPPYAVAPVAGDTMTLQVTDTADAAHVLHFRRYMYATLELVYACAGGHVVIRRDSGPVGMLSPEGMPAPMLRCSLALKTAPKVSGKVTPAIVGAAHRMDADA